MHDYKYYILVAKEEWRQLLDQKRTILNKKISPTKKQKQWNELLNYKFEQDDSYLAGNIF